MAVFSRPVDKTIVVSEKEAKRILSAPVDKSALEKIRSRANKFQKNNAGKK